MRDILRSNYLSVWNGTNKVNENRSGGVALWTLPPFVYNAHNPAMFVREKYLHVTDGYTSPFEKKPCYVSIDNDEVKYTFGAKTASDIFITANTDKGEVSVKVMRGVTEWAMSKYCTKINAILYISFSAASFPDFPPEDNTCIYLKPNEAYNGGLYICKDKDNIAYRNTAIDSSELSFYFGDGSNVSLTAESFGGKTMFNASEVVKSKFAESLAVFGKKVVISDPALYVGHTVSARVTASSFVAVNGVSQIGDSQDRTEETGRILTTLERLKYYENYPLDYTVMAAEKAVATSNGDIQQGTIGRVLVYSGKQKNLQDEVGKDVLVQQVEEVLLGFDMDRRIFRMCTPARPFYVRWLNCLGGVDYFMFGKTQKQTRSVKSVSTFSPFVENTETAATNKRAYAMSAEASVTAGASMLSRQDYDALQNIPFSPLIEWYNEADSKWIRLTVEKFDGSIDTKGEKFGVEITFVLPAINVQY